MSDPSPNPTVPTPPTSADEHEALERPHCWECRRRRLVCDGTQPVCTKCRTAGIVCPGYADKKPLTWLAPGQVMSRPRKKKALRKPRKESACKKQQSKTTLVTSPGDNQLEADDRAIPPPAELRPEIYDMFEAMLYYNACIYPDLTQHQLGPSRFVMPVILVDGLPSPILHMLVSVVLSHRIIQTAEHPASDQLVKPMWTRLYHHRDIAVSAINKLIADEAERGSIETIAAVYTLLYAMVQQSFTNCWRIHLNGFMSLIQLHGSFFDLIKKVPDMDLSLMALIIVTALANTTSPHNSQMQVAPKADTLRLLQTYYTETYYPSVTCPPELFIELVLINDLRAQPPSPETSATATLILSRIDSFSPESWSAARETSHQYQNDWLLLSSIFHASTALYAILSLQSSGALSRTSARLGIARARHARKLFALLETALAAPRVRRRMTWPLVVAGVEAARASAEVQRYIAESLVRMSRDQGYAPPLVARGVLERFWARGGGGWDECFPEPLCLVL